MKIIILMGAPEWKRNSSSNIKQNLIMVIFQLAFIAALDDPDGDLEDKKC